MHTLLKGFVGLVALVGSQSVFAAAPTFPADARVSYTGTTSDAGVQACDVEITTDALARPVTVLIKLPNAAEGNVNHLDATLDYTPLLPGSALVLPTASGYTVNAAKLTSGLLEILTVEVTGDDAQGLKALAITRNFTGVLGAKISCNELKPL